MRPQCTACGATDFLSDDMKRWIIRLYEAATGKVLLVTEDRWIHKRVFQTAMVGDAARCGLQTKNQVLRWKRVTCPRCLS